MARLLRDNDYLRLIQSDNLLQIIESNQSIKLDIEQSAQAEMISYLAQRYITSRIFTDTTTYSDSVSYKGKNLVEYHEPAFSASTIYTTGQRVSQGGYIYSSIAGSAAHAFNAAEWTQLTEDYSFYYITLPYNEYDNSASYVVGNQVWYNDIVYTARTSVTGILPTNSAYWTAGSTYSVIAGTKPTDTTKWTKGDNRNQQIVLYLIDITLYHLHSRINPRNIPDLRKERYDGNGPTQSGGAIGWLKRVASGDITADLPSILPQQGMAIRWGNADGSTTRASNMY